VGLTAGYLSNSGLLKTVYIADLESLKKLSTYDASRVGIIAYQSPFGILNAEGHPIYSAVGFERYESDLQVFRAVNGILQSKNHDRVRIADRLRSLYRDATDEGDEISQDSLHQFMEFFTGNPEIGLPKITLTPHSTLRARWIHGSTHFLAVEFTGRPLLKIVAEIPRDRNQVARYFFEEMCQQIMSTTRAIGAWK
jgi:hypothetical protein